MSRILMVDDAPLNLALLHAHLETCGYQLSEASTGEEALEIAQGLPPDLILLDVRMPGMGGFEACRRFKRAAAERGEFLPIVLLTAHDEAPSRRQGLDAGADDFLGKPFDPIELTLRIHNLLALRADRTALHQRNQRLVELQQFKEEMSALLVHDLKNPASAILANLEFVIDGLPKAMPAETVAEALEDARDSCRRTLRLLANLLDVARAEDNRLELHRAPTSLSAIIAPLVQNRQLAAEYRGLKLAMQLDAEAIAPIDADIVGRVVENVLDNALRYTPRGGTINLATRKTNGNLQVRIGNTGTPIPAESRTVIFEKYGQLNADRKQHLNSGLGLYFCRLATEAHGGRIWVEEEPNLATVFVVSLPIEALVAAKEGDATPPTS